MTYHPTLFTGVGVGILLLIVLIVLAVLAFELWMLVSAVKNPAITTERKVLWIVLMFLIHPFVAIVYYFTDHQKGKLTP